MKVVIMLMCGLAVVVTAQPSPHAELIRHTINACLKSDQQQQLLATLQNHLVVHKELDIDAISLAYHLSVSPQQRAIKHTVPVALIPVMYKNPAVLKMLLDAGADQNTRQMYSQRTMLMLAAAQWDLSTVKLVMRYSPDVNTTDVYGNTALSLALDSKPATNDSACKQHQVVSILCKSGARLPDQLCAKNHGSLMRKYSPEIAHILLSTGSIDLAHTNDFHKRTRALIDAVRTSSYTEVNELLRTCVNPNGLAKETPLAIAAQKGDIPMVRMLLAWHADVNRSVGRCHNVLTTVLRSIGQNKYQEIGISDEKVTHLIQLLIEHGARIPWAKRSDFASCMRATCSHRGLCKSLVEKGLFYGGTKAISIYNEPDERLVKWQLAKNKSDSLLFLCRDRY